MKHLIILFLTLAMGAWFFSRRKYELASAIQWKFFIGTVYVMPVFGTLSSFALSQKILAAFLRGDFFGPDTQSLWSAWFFSGPTMILLMNIVLYFAVFRKLTPENIYQVPSKVVKTVSIFLVMGIITMVGLLQLRGLLTIEIAFSVPAHMVTLTYFMILLGYVNVEKMVRQYTEINYGSLTKRMVLNTILPLGFSILYMIDAAYLVSISDNSAQLIFMRLFCAFAMLMSVFSYCLYETLKMLIIPVQQLSRALSGISSGEGDLTRRLYVETRDEIGNISVYLNRFLRQVYDIVRTIAEITSMVNRSTTDLVQSSNRMLVSTQEIAASLDSSDQSTERVNQQITQLDIASAAIAENAAVTSRRSREMEDLVGTGVESMNNMVESMHRINDSTKKIGGILGDIRGIAKQTNLLSLNAAIEAAKAGEHGKGFAVVAQHVRELAERSTNATVNIQGLITESVDRVHDGDEAVKNVQSILNEVSELVHASTESVAQITQAAKEQSTLVHETFNEITLLRKLSSTNASSTKDIKAIVEAQDLSVQGLQENTSALISSVSQFKIGS
ncbi:MAG: methyl-accepting chemotaxis protein [SAR324 cluster bacterium]|nr:methyl-accepting chemotaxis protein [SAR324 cluster bacterium]